MNQDHYLIVDQQQNPPETLPQLLKELAGSFALDIYQCRQRLIGQGLSLLVKGSKEKLTQISQLLRQNGFKHWLFVPSKPRFAPQRLQGLAVSSEKIVFRCQQKTVTLHKGARVLAVFAELSGALAEQSVKQLLSSNAYRGRDNVRHLAAHKIERTILQGQPVLDLYLLDDQGQISDAVRVFPGKFDPKGLGERATLSSKQNLKQVLRLAEEYAGDFHLQSDFGLANLPGCTLRTDDRQNPETLRQNLISLARYGWLLADLLRSEPIEQSQKQNDDVSAAAAAALGTQNPELLAAGQAADIHTLAQEVAAAIDAPEAESQAAVPPVTAEPGLPAPPAGRRYGRWRALHFWLGGGGSMAAILGMLVLEADNRFFKQFIHQAIASGTIPLLLAALCFWGGFYFLRLKRQVENTPTSKIRSVAMGMVEVKGRALRKYALLSPMSHVPCVFYRVTKYRRENNNQWSVSSVTSSDNVPFLIEDDSGQVEVDPAGCRVRAGTKQEGVPGQVGLMRLNDSDEKWVEEIVVEGTLLYVLGFAAVKKATGPTMNERKREALRELKRNPQQLQQFDSDGDGRISEQEWDAAREAVADKVLLESLQQKQARKKQEEHIVIEKRKGRPLVIAESHSEEQLTGKLTLYSVSLFITAATATVWGLRVLSGYLK